MTQSNGSISILWPQLVYALPIILVSIAAVVVCVMNWQKAPTPALLCLIGFGLIGFNSIFGTFVTSMLIRSGSSSSMIGQILSIISAVRILFSVAGYVFLLVAVFSGRQHHAAPDAVESASNRPASPR